MDNSIETTILHAQERIIELMKQFYSLGWVFGTGGAMCIRVEVGGTFVTAISPSAVQKERLEREDVAIVNNVGEAIGQAKSVSSCAKLFRTIFTEHDNSHSQPLLCVIHTHSVEANLIASFPHSKPYNLVRLSTEEMLKGIVNRQTGKMYSNTEECDIPVIENAPSEGCPEVSSLFVKDISPQFSERIKEAMASHPQASAILVRHHGAFYFGKSWEETKVMAEIFEYLFKLQLQKIQFSPELANCTFKQL